jgi:glycosyltransferase involved in cell wall biosynthesis
MKVVFFQRKPVPNKNFSIEILFNQIRANLPSDILPQIEMAKHYSRGFFKRLYITVDAIFKQGEVNHITGDINFISLFLKKKRTIITFLDLRVLKHPNPIARKILAFFWVKVPIWRSKYITTISAATKKTLLNYINIDPDRVRVMYIPVADLMEYTPKPFDKDNITILQIGTKKNKNILRLVEAIKDIPCTLEIVGVLEDEQLALLEKYNIKYNNHVNISNEALKDCYTNADLLAFVSTHEGFGMPIVEAQIVGRPVITSNLLSMPEVAGDGAHIVDPYDVEAITTGIKKIIEDEDYREKLVKNGVVNAERFDAKKIANQYADLYREIYENQ